MVTEAGELLAAETLRLPILEAAADAAQAQQEGRLSSRMNPRVITSPPARLARLMTGIEIASTRPFRPLNKLN